MTFRYWGVLLDEKELMDGYDREWFFEEGDEHGALLLEPLKHSAENHMERRRDKKRNARVVPVTLTVEE